MANTCAILRNIETLSQTIADFLSQPGPLTPDVANTLINDIELLRGAVRELPRAEGPKNDILDRLAQAQTLLSSGILGANTILAVLAILQVVTVKVQNRPIPCAQGFTLVHPSKPFSTICQICN